jgi:hypothetical protein
MYSQFLSMVPEKKESSPVGLCADCTHARKIESSRGSSFLLCQLSATNPRFPKYPRLPVLQCSGFQRLTRDV